MELVLLESHGRISRALAWAQKAMSIEEILGDGVEV